MDRLKVSLNILLADALELRTTAGQYPPLLSPGRVLRVPSTLIHISRERHHSEACSTCINLLMSRLQVSPDAHVRSLVGSRLNVANCLRPHSAPLASASCSQEVSCFQYAIPTAHACRRQRGVTGDGATCTIRVRITPAPASPLNGDDHTPGWLKGHLRCV